MSDEIPKAAAAGSHHNTKAAVVWLTGRPASGKSTLAHQLVSTLRQRGVAHLWLDSDDLREVMTPVPTYSEQERDAVYATIARIALRAFAGGVFVIISATGSRRRYRDALRQQFADRFVEVWVHCEETTLRQRDPKGLYAAAAQGTIRGLPGGDAAYEAPPHPELCLNSDHSTPPQLATTVLEWLHAHALLPPPEED